MKRIILAVVVVALAGTLVTADEKKAQVMFQSAIAKETLQGDLKGAIAMFENVVAEAGVGRALAAQALVRMAECYQKLGDSEARKVYYRIVREFADQIEAVTLARARLGGSATGIETSAKGDRAVWTGRMVDMFGQVSPDGRFISYVDWVGTFNLMVHEVATNTDRALTNLPSMVNNPKWVWQAQAGYSTFSKDGKQIAYAWELGDSKDIRIIDLQTNAPAPRRLLNVKDEEFRFISPYDWSPDGRWLAVLLNRTDGTGQIAVTSVADGSMRVLKSVDWKGPERIFFSPDSRYLAYDLPVGDSREQRDIFVMAIDGSREMPAVAHEANEKLFGWSPDGRLLLFSSDRTGSTGLWAQPFVEQKPFGAPELLRADIGASSFSLGLTAAGSLVVYRNTSSRDIRVAPIDLTTGRLSAPPREFGQGFLPNPRTPDWSKDGKYLAYQACGGDCVAIRSVETGQVRQLPRTVLYPRDPRWSPDGRSLIVAARDKRGRNGLFQLDAQTGAIMWTLAGPGFQSFPHWSTDGKKILYLIRRNGIMEHDLATGTERQIAKNPLLNFDISLSPDGTHVAARALDNPNKTQTLLVIPTAGGAPRELLRLQGPDELWRGSTIWTPDGKSLIVPQTVSSRLGVWLVPIDGSTPRKLDLDYSSWIEGAQGPLDEGFSLSPDGRSIVFPMGKNSAEVWALENILPTQTPKK